MKQTLNIYLFIYIFIDNICTICITISPTPTDQLESAFDYNLRQFTRLTIVVSQSEAQPPIVAVADHFDRLRLYDDVHKNRIKKNHISLQE
jgi:hypothetical protein